MRDHITSILMVGSGDTQIGHPFPALLQHLLVNFRLVFSGPTVSFVPFPLHQEYVFSVRMYIWVKVFKNGPSKICGRQPVKNLK